MINRRRLLQSLMAVGAAVIAIPEPVQKIFQSNKLQKIEVAVHYPEREVQWDMPQGHNSRLLGGIEPLGEEAFNSGATFCPLTEIPRNEDPWGIVYWNPQPTVIQRGDTSWSQDAEIYDALRYGVPH